MIDKIKELSNGKLSKLDYLRNSKLPLLLYGAGKYASIVEKYLENEDIKIDCVVVNKNYFKPNIYFNNLPVNLLDDVLNEQSSVNVIFGFYKYREEMERLSSCKKIKRMFFFDGLLFPGFDLEFIETHYSIMEGLYHRLEDRLSKEILVAFIIAKQSLCSNELYKLNVKDESQYFPSFIKLDEDEVFVDCGAYDGDTSLVFNKLMLNSHGGGGG
jgi:hypothetical protein